MTQEELTDLSRSLGGPNPEGWASSQVKEGIPQLDRFIVLRGMWELVTPAKNSNWIDYELNQRAESSLGQALREVLDCGVKKKTINTLIRLKQAELLCSVCYMLEDYSSVTINQNADTGEEYVRWSLMKLDDDDRPMKPVDGLHESFWRVEPHE